MNPSRSRPPIISIPIGGSQPLSQQDTGPAVNAAMAKVQALLAKPGGLPLLQAALKWAEDEWEKEEKETAELKEKVETAERVLAAHKNALCEHLKRRKVDQ